MDYEIVPNCEFVRGEGARVTGSDARYRRPLCREFASGSGLWLCSSWVAHPFLLIPPTSFTPGIFWKVRGQSESIRVKFPTLLVFYLFSCLSFTRSPILHPLQTRLKSLALNIQLFIY